MPVNEGTTVPHPLDPLTAAEIGQAAAIVRRERGVGEGWRFASIELKEPAKADLPALAAGEVTRREALVVCWDRADGQAYRAVVSLTGDAVTGWEHLPGQQPNMTVDEWHECDEMIRAHPAVADALARRGVTDLTRVLADMWAYGAAFVPERYAGRRIGWCDLWYRGSELGNPYAHHLTGLHPVVDLNTMELLEIEDSYQGGADPEVMGEYLPDLLPMRLRSVAPLEISQPDGVGFTLDGTCSGGRTGSCGSASTTARAWSCTRSRSPTAIGCGRWRTGCRSRRWWCRTGTPARTTTGGPRSTSASGASAS